MLSKLQNKMFVLLLAGGIVSSAHAICVEDCSSFSVGVGGLYSKFNGSNAGVESSGGYVSLEAYKVTGRIKSYSSVQFGAGNSTLSGATLADLGNPPNHFLVFTPKIGVNIASKNAPIFVNFFGELYLHDTSNSKGVERELITLGGEIEGIIPAGNALSITYSAGYGWLGYAHYKLDGVDSRVGAGANYMIKASVGASYVLSDSVSTYLRLIGRYYNTAKDSAIVQVNGVDKSYPASSSYVGMVEIGLEF
ncbi:hypothetical protein [Helicobacter sp. 23-1046]